MSSFERQVLTLRSGLSGPELSRGQTAHRLGTSSARVARGEHSGLRGLREAAQSTGCGGSSAMSFGDTDQMATATVAVATGSAPSLRSVATMADAPEDSLAIHPANQVLGATASSTPPPGDEAKLEAATLTASVPTIDEGPSPLYLLLLLLLVPLAALAAVVLLRRRHEPAVAAMSPPPAPPAPAPAPPAAAAAAPVPAAAPVEDRPAAQELWTQPGWEPPPPAEHHPAEEELDDVVPNAEPASPPEEPAHRGRTAAGVAAGVVSVALGGLLSRRFGGRRRR